MQLGALAPYEDSLRDHEPIAIRHDDGRRWTLDVDRWLAAVDDADRSVVARLNGGPTLDVGCGPGRMVEAATRSGVLALGIDIAPAAVELTRGRGMNAVRCDVFGPVPGRGRWTTIMLIDGNIGIGGDPSRLLTRLNELLAPGGSILLETDPDKDIDELVTVRFERGGIPVGNDFPWALVGSNALRSYARSAKLAVENEWSVTGRTFATLRSNT